MKRAIRVWIDRIGNVEKEVLPVKFNDEASDETVLAYEEPSGHVGNEWKQRGFSLCNWHVIEEAK